MIHHHMSYRIHKKSRAIRVLYSRLLHLQEALCRREVGSLQYLERIILLFLKTLYIFIELKSERLVRKSDERNRVQVLHSLLLGSLETVRGGHSTSTECQFCDITAFHIESERLSSVEEFDITRVHILKSEDSTSVCIKILLRYLIVVNQYDIIGNRRNHLHLKHDITFSDSACASSASHCKHQ